MDRDEPLRVGGRFGYVRVAYFRDENNVVEREPTVA